MLATVPDPSSTDLGLALLAGPEVSDLLGVALEPAGGRLLHWTLRDVDYRPGRRTTASYAALVAWPDGERHETLAASVSAAEPTSAVSATPATPGLIVTDGDRHVQVWRFPFDPELPGLAAACSPETVAALLRNLGISPDRLSLRVVSYRPRKRAVIAVTTADRRLFVKVLRPRLVANIDRRHRLLTASGLGVPRSLGWSDDGLIVLTELPGLPMRAALETGVPPLRRPDDLVGLLDRLPAEVAELPRRRPWSVHAAHYADVIAAAGPDHASTARALAHEIESRIAQYDDGDEPTHGDFYDSQLFVADGAVTGLLDIDTVGPGRRADDLGCLLAHLSVLAASDFDAAAGARRALEQWLPALERQVDPAELHVRAAGVVLSLATGPFRAQEPAWPEATSRRLGLAEWWLNGAGNSV